MTTTVAPRLIDSLSCVVHEHKVKNPITAITNALHPYLKSRDSFQIRYIFFFLRRDSV